MPFGGGALPVSGPAVTSTESPESARLAMDRVLDAVFYAPIGLLLSVDAQPSELASRGRRHVEAAQLLGRLALDRYSASPAPGEGSAEAEPS